MEAVDRSLIALKLILEEFNIRVAEPLRTKQDPVNMDLVSSIISLVQIAHPLGYDFSLVEIPYYTIRCKKLSTEVHLLSKRTGTGELIINERKWKLSERVQRRVNYIVKGGLTPEELQGKFTNPQWAIFMGVYNIASRICPNEALVDIFMKDYIEFLPYMDLAEEIIRDLHFNVELIGE